MDHCDSDNHTRTNYAWRDMNGGFRSMMAESCKTGPCVDGADDNTVNCTRVQYFSNPDILYNGAQLGDKNNNCAGEIRSVVAAVENYYPDLFTSKVR